MLYMQIPLKHAMSNMKITIYINPSYLPSLHNFLHEDLSFGETIRGKWTVRESLPNNTLRAAVLIDYDDYVKLLDNE